MEIIVNCKIRNVLHYHSQLFLNSLMYIIVKSNVLQATQHYTTPVSYTHLDVYKRQALDGGASLVSAGRVMLEAVTLRLSLKF